MLCIGTACKRQTWNEIAGKEKRSLKFHFENNIIFKKI